MSLKLPRLSAQMAVTTERASTPFSRFWNQFANAIETAFNGNESLSADFNALAAGVAFRDQSNEFTGANTFDQPPNSTFGYKVRSIQVVGQQQIGWTASTGTAGLGAFSADATRTLGASYVQSDVQAMQDDLTAARQRIKALEDAMRTHGLIN